MAFVDWLFGPKLMTGSAAGWALGSSYTVSISDVLAIGEEMKKVFPTVLYFRAETGPLAAGLGMAIESATAVDPRTLSDSDLGGLFINGYAAESPVFPVVADLSLLIGGKVMATMNVYSSTPIAAGPGSPLFHRIEEILTSGRRRVPAWRWVRFARWAGVLVLLALLIATAVAVRDEPSLVVVAGLGLLAFAWQANGRIDTWAARHQPNLMDWRGSVRIDATDYDGLRNRRANSKRDLKVALLTVGGGVLLALLGWTLDLISFGG